MESSLALGFEGPYGALGHRFQRLMKSGTNRFLLIAGGVGASAMMPLYRAILAYNPDARVDFIWAIKNASEATWPISPAHTKSITDDPNVKLYLTGEIDIPYSPRASGEEEDEIDGLTLEMDEISTEAGGGSTRNDSTATLVPLSNKRRPDLQHIINDTFTQGDEAVAVAVCGPQSMSRDVRKWVALWAARGKDVWYHDETFGW